MKVATWNVEWASPESGRGVSVSALLSQLDCELLVVTEGSAALLPLGGHVVDAGDAWGYGIEPSRRKVMAWSRVPWRDVRRLDRGAGQGRVVAGTTDTSIGPVIMVAVCIPWRECHVRTGRRDASLWSEHLECCAQIGELLEDLPSGVPVLIMGDFNQRLPRHRQPEHVHTALIVGLRGLTVWTEGETATGRLIDHIASSGQFIGSTVEVWPGQSDAGYLSDHAGVALRLAFHPPDT